MTETWTLAAVWIGLALVATLVSIWFRVATALSEIVVGTVAQLVIGALMGGAFLGTDQSWIKFLSGAGAILLTFLAGAELDPAVFRLIRAGSLVSVPALIAAPGVLLLLLASKVLCKMVAVWPATQWFNRGGGRESRVEGVYTTLLMSTGLTFGSIASLFGLSHQIIDTAQYSYLVAAVIVSAVVPTVIANAFYLPRHLLAQPSGAVAPPVPATQAEKVAQ
jgi:Kef-type K+ transport system membrane component KefB